MRIISLRQLWQRATAHLDPPLMIIAMTLMLIGFLTVFSATYDSQNRLMAQMLNMAVAFVLMWLLAQVSPQKLMQRLAVRRPAVALLSTWFSPLKDGLLASNRATCRTAEGRSRSFVRGR